MARIKHTKTELKAQKEALERFERFLPMLQLKKQQLQTEVQLVVVKLAGKEEERKQTAGRMESWIGMFSEDTGIEKLIALKDISLREGNIAGVSIPMLDRVDIDVGEYDLFETPAWIDDGLEHLRRLITLRVELETLAEQIRRLKEELRTTTQRVNLFEKVKIPECRENIRAIKIFLGEEQTASVVRGKIAKSRTIDYQYAEETV